MKYIKSANESYLNSVEYQKGFEDVIDRIIEGIGNNIELESNSGGFSTRYKLNNEKRLNNDTFIYIIQRVCDFFESKHYNIHYNILYDNKNDNNLASMTYIDIDWRQTYSPRSINHAFS